MSDHLLCICCIFSEHFLSWEHLWRVACVNGVSSILILYLDVSTVCHLYLISCFILFFNIKSSHRRCSVRKVFLEISQNSHEKNLCQSLFFNKVAGKETLAQVFFCEIWETKKTFSYRTPLGNCFCFIMKVIDVTRNKNPGLLNR